MTPTIQTEAEVARRDALTPEERTAEDAAGYTATPEVAPVTEADIAARDGFEHTDGTIQTPEEVARRAALTPDERTAEDKAGYVAGPVETPETLEARRRNALSKADQDSDDQTVRENAAKDVNHDGSPDYTVNSDGNYVYADGRVTRPDGSVV